VRYEEVEDLEAFCDPHLDFVPGELGVRQCLKGPGFRFEEVETLRSMPMKLGPERDSDRDTDRQADRTRGKYSVKTISEGKHGRRVKHEEGEELQASSDPHLDFVPGELGVRQYLKGRLISTTGLEHALRERESGCVTERERGSQADRDRQTDRQTDRDRRTGRQTEREGKRV